MDEREAWLVSQAREGDIASFSVLVETYQERVIRSAYSILGNIEDAKDSAQEAFVKAYENLQSFNSDSKFYTWLHRIMINVCRDFLRKKKLRKMVSLWSDRDGGVNLADTLSAKDKSASQTLDSKELGDLIYLALEKLPFQQRSAFTLKYLNGMSLEEIAESMDLSLGAIKAHIWQASEKLRKILKYQKVWEVENG